MKSHEISLSSVSSVALSLLSGVILIAPGTIMAGPTAKDADSAGKGDVPVDQAAQSAEADKPK